MCKDIRNIFEDKLSKVLLKKYDSWLDLARHVFDYANSSIRSISTLRHHSFSSIVISYNYMIFVKFDNEARNIMSIWLV